MNARKKQRKFGYIKICLYICIQMVGQVPHRWAPSKGLVLFSYLWQKLEFPNGSLASLRGNLLKKEEKFGFFKTCLYICNVRKR